MSGRKQHYIPQSLLRGFGFASKGKKIKVRVVTFDGRLFIAATDGIGAERDFYSELDASGGETLDDKITAFEGGMAVTLSEFRDLEDRARVDPFRASEIVSHLAIRNDHVRKTMVHAGEAMFSGLGNALAEEETARRALGMQSGNISASTKKILSEELDKHEVLLGAFGLDRATLERIVLYEVDRNFSSIHETIVKPATQHLVSKKSEIPGIAASAQRKSLHSEITPEKRVEILSRMDWEVRHSAEQLILPDCIVLTLDRNGDVLPHLFSGADNALLHIVPISSSRMLVGGDQTAALPMKLRTMAAGCSWDFFVAPDDIDEVHHLQGEIRSITGGLIDDTTSSAIESAISSDDNGAH